LIANFELGRARRFRPLPTCTGIRLRSIRASGCPR